MWRSTAPEFPGISLFSHGTTQFQGGFVDARHVEDAREANVRCFCLQTSVLNSAK
jgi:hypothetical protein